MDVDTMSADTMSAGSGDQCVFVTHFGTSLAESAKEPAVAADHIGAVPRQRWSPDEPCTTSSEGVVETRFGRGFRIYAPYLVHTIINLSTNRRFLMYVSDVRLLTSVQTLVS